MVHSIPRGRPTDLDISSSLHASNDTKITNMTSAESFTEFVLKDAVDVNNWMQIVVQQVRWKKL